MTPKASKQGQLDSLGAIFLFIFLPCMWGLGFRNDSPNYMTRKNSLGIYFEIIIARMVVFPVKSRGPYQALLVIMPCLVVAACFTELQPQTEVLATARHGTQGPWRITDLTRPTCCQGQPKHNHNHNSGLLKRWFWETVVLPPAENRGF